MSLPACDAVTVHEPAEAIVIVAPLSPPEVQVPDAVNVTALPDAPPLAVTVNGASPYTASAGCAKVMVWFPFTSGGLLPFVPASMHCWYGSGRLEKKS